jgi:hypothetical protein
MEATEISSNSRMFKVNDQEFERARELKYLGSTITEDNKITTEIKQRILMANRASYGPKETIKFTIFRETDKMCST